MTPQQVLNDAVASFGQFSGRTAQVEDDFWDVLWEVETVLKPSEALRTAVFTANWLPDLGEISLPAGAFEVDRVVRASDGVASSRVHLDAVYGMPPWFQTASAWAWDPIGKRVVLNRGSSLSPPTDFVVGYWEHTPRSAVDVDLPVLDRLYPILRVGLMAKLARKVKDTERMRLFEEEYVRLLGGGG